MADSKVSALTAVSSVTGGQEFLVNDAAVSKKATATQIQTFVLASYAGATSIVTLGTVATGTWQGSVIDSTYGGTGVNNAGRTLTISTLSGTINFNASNKILTINNTIGLSGTDATTMTFPSTNATIARTDAAQTFTGTQTFSSTIVGSINGNAATVTTNANLTGNVTSSGNATTIANSVVSLAMLANLAANSLIGNSTGSSATPTAVSMVSTATASSVLFRDSSANAFANNFLSGYTTTATAAGTTTLTVGSTRVQIFTGSTTQTVTLPVVSTLALGHTFEISNKSSGAVTVNSSGANAVLVMAANSTLVVMSNATTGTSAAVWDIQYHPTLTNSAGNNVIPKSDGTSLVASVLTESSGNILLGASAKLGSVYQTGFIGFHEDTTQNAIRITPQGASGSYFKVFEESSTDLYFQFVPKATAGFNGLTRFDSYSSPMVFGVTGSNSIYLTGTQVGINHINPSALLDVKGTTQQLRLRYDDSNYMSFVVDSAGSTTFDLLGTSPVFSFGKNILLIENATIDLDAALSADGKYSGICEVGTAGATLAFGDLIYFVSGTSKWALTDADAESTSGGVKVGICVLAASADAATKVLLNGKIRADAKFPALTVGAPVFISGTAGLITNTAPVATDSVTRIIGYGNTADELAFYPSNDWMTHV